MLHKYITKKNWFTLKWNKTAFPGEENRYIVKKETDTYWAHAV